MRTALYEHHLKLNAKMVPFASWDMPLYYEGIFQEVEAVRNHVGLFDVSHMGRISVTGPHTLSFLDYLSTNTVFDKPFGKAFYTIFCNEEGFCVDDLLIYLIDSQHAFLIVNAANRQKDLLHLMKYEEKYDVEIEPHYEEGILSLQGPESRSMMNDFPPLSPFEFIRDNNLIISRTGYTGEEGYEFYGPSASIVSLWEKFLQKAKPCGLGARDVLRLEKGYALYGHELSVSIYPTESVAKWVVRPHDFLGKRALDEVKQLRFPVALVGVEKIPAREGYPIFYKQQKIGQITSGTFSPTFDQPIALGLVDRKLDENIPVEVLIRSVYHPFKTRRPNEIHRDT